jgi:hypothetical protein
VFRDPGLDLDVRRHESHRAGDGAGNGSEGAVDRPMILESSGTMAGSSTARVADDEDKDRAAG